MIIDLPTADSFQARSISLLNLAWEVTLAIQMHHDSVIQEAAEANAEWNGRRQIWPENEIAEQTETFWRRSQHELQNAHALIHQAVELGLKGRICAVSPFLLIARDIRDYPSKSDQQDTAFSKFRTIEAADLVRVADTVCDVRLTDDFKSQWASIRDIRNVGMHSVDEGVSLRPPDLVRAILMVNEFLFGDENFARRRSAYLFADHRNTAYEITYYSFHISRSLSEIETAIDLLTPAECRRFFKFRKKDRRYFCVICDDQSNKYEAGLPHLAQLTTKRRGEKSLYCCACGSNLEVRREPCAHADCSGDVISQIPYSDGLCLTCERFPER